jgi:hypothetical protein
MADRSVEEMEAVATVVARRELALPLNAAIDVLNLASKLHANDIPEERLPKAKIVRLLLLQRVQNDLRCCVILVEHGYPLQAAALAAGVFEAWATLGNVRTEEDAAKWLSHSRENASFGPIYNLTRQAIENMGVDARVADKLYSQYQQLCMAKHLNPLVEGGRGYIRVGNSVEFLPGPDTSELAVGLGWFALERASRFAHFALQTMADSQESPAELHLALVAQQALLEDLQTESVNRWPKAYSV